jgi:hypothetical protein
MESASFLTLKFGPEAGAPAEAWFVVRVGFSGVWFAVRIWIKRIEQVNQEIYLGFDSLAGYWRIRGIKGISHRSLLRAVGG